MEALEALTNYYSSRNEDMRFQSKHGQVEYLTTIRYIEKYLTPGARILEAGAGTGIYSIALARLGYTVEAVELIEHNINIFREKLTPDMPVSLRQGNIMDLSCFKDESFDITLVLGPMYHLFTESDKLKALTEALRVTKKGGVLFTAYCISDASIICHGFKDGNIHSLIESGLLDTQTFTARSTPAEVFVLHRKSDIEKMMSNFNVERLHYVATDLATNFMRETIDAMDDKTFEVYLKYHFAMCERPDLVGVTHHSLDIVRKL